MGCLVVKCWVAALLLATWLRRPTSDTVRPVATCVRQCHHHHHQQHQKQAPKEPIFKYVVRVHGLSVCVCAWTGVYRLWSRRKEATTAAQLCQSLARYILRARLHSHAWSATMRNGRSSKRHLNSAGRLLPPNWIHSQVQNPQLSRTAVPVASPAMSRRLSTIGDCRFYGCNHLPNRIRGVHPSAPCHLVASARLHSLRQSATHSLLAQHENSKDSSAHWTRKHRLSVSDSR